MVPIFIPVGAPDSGHGCLLSNSNPEGIPMGTIQIHVERLRTMMKERGWTERDQAMDISLPYLNRRLKG